MSAPAYTIVNEPDVGNTSVQEFKSLLEKPRDEVKIDAMKRILVVMLNGDPMPDLLMHIIRYVMPSKSKELKKLLQFYWEICPKTDASGKLKQEMILVCNALMNDLQHPNEYIRGSALRFLGKIKEPELLEPLVPNCRTCLQHRHSYIRKNAVLAVFAIYQVSEHLIPDAREIIAEFLDNETDPTCKRNAFLALSAISKDDAFLYLKKNLHNINSADSLLQLAFLEFIPRDAVTRTEFKSTYLRVVFDLLDAPQPTVVYEAATTLVILTTLPAAISAAAAKLIDLATKEADNNVKLIVLDKVQDLSNRFPGVLQDSALDILRVLSTPDQDVRKKALDLALSMVTSRTVDSTVKVLKKELAKTLGTAQERTGEYRALLIHAIHQCAISFAEVAADVVDLLLDFLPELSTTAATDVISFVKEAVEKYPAMRSAMVGKLVDTLSEIRSGKVSRGILWIIGEYCLDEREILQAWKAIRACVGDVPIVDSERRRANGEDGEDSGESVVGPSGGIVGPKVLPDGTYATESALTAAPAAAVGPEADAARPKIRGLILDGDFYLASVLASTFTKLVVRLWEIEALDKRIKNSVKAEAMLMMVSILRAGESEFAKRKIDEDAAERILSCIRFLAELEENRSQHFESALLKDTKEAFRAQLAEEDRKRLQEDKAAKEKSALAPDTGVVFRQLAKLSTSATKDVYEEDLKQAAGAVAKTEGLMSRLRKIVPLTGFSDPVYAEAFVRVHQFDIVLDVLLVNQTTETLRNLAVEFATLGDLKIVEKPAIQNLGAHGFLNVQCTIKVSSADTAIIFGNIVYDGQAANEHTIVILNDVHVNIMEYIKPATCSEAQFRVMWNKFEWENKVNISSKLKSLKEYLDRLMKATNMACLTPGAVVGDECQFLSANLYARSSFGEDALANLSIEKDGDGPIVGHIRIRSKGQGLALALGEKIASTEKAAQGLAV